ncbi:Protein of unknown function [Lactobacillus helveticus CIRM-BIA 104]|nr:Protein of unknown function [Lactobacillus helveticus CIRM-BIA 104]
MIKDSNVMKEFIAESKADSDLEEL